MFASVLSSPPRSLLNLLTCLTCTHNSSLFSSQNKQTNKQTDKKKKKKKSSLSRLAAGETGTQGRGDAARIAKVSASNHAPVQLQQLPIQSRMRFVAAPKHSAPLLRQHRQQRMHITILKARRGAVQKVQHQHVQRRVLSRRRLQNPGHRFLLTSQKLAPTFMCVYVCVCMCVCASVCKCVHFVFGFCVNGVCVCVCGWVLGRLGRCRPLVLPPMSPFPCPFPCPCPFPRPKKRTSDCRGLCGGCLEHQGRVSRAGRSMPAAHQAPAPHASCLQQRPAVPCTASSTALRSKCRRRTAAARAAPCARLPHRQLRAMGQTRLWHPLCWWSRVLLVIAPCRASPQHVALHSHGN